MLTQIVKLSQEKRMHVLHILGNFPRLSRIIWGVSGLLITLLSLYPMRVKFCFRVHLALKLAMLENYKSTSPVKARLSGPVSVYCIVKYYQYVRTSQINDYSYGSYAL